MILDRCGCARTDLPFPDGHLRISTKLLRSFNIGCFAKRGALFDELSHHPHLAVPLLAGFSPPPRCRLGLGSRAPLCRMPSAPDARLRIPLWTAGAGAAAGPVLSISCQNWRQAESCWNSAGLPLNNIAVLKIIIYLGGQI